MPTLPVDMIVDYVDSFSDYNSQYYEAQKITPSGHLRYGLADPIGTAFHTNDYYVLDTDIQFTLPIQPYKLNQTQKNALWMGLRASVNVVQKGRLVK